MLVHKDGKIKNCGEDCRDVTPTKLQSQNIFKESTGGGGGSGWGGGGQDGCERRIKVFVKIQKKIFFLGGSGRGEGWIGGGCRVGGQGRCEQRSEFFVKIYFFFFFFWGGGQVGGCSGGGHSRVDVNKELKFL